MSEWVVGRGQSNTDTFTKYGIDDTITMLPMEASKNELRPLNIEVCIIQHVSMRIEDMTNWLL